MTENKLSISIGISAYNEEENIVNLVDALFKQKLKSGELIKIHVISDGSTDNTVEFLKKISDARLLITERETRIGKVASQNEIAKSAQSDVLVLLDADVLPKDENFLEELIQPFLTNTHVGLVSANTINATPKNFVEKIIADSHEFKNFMYTRLHHKDNIYLSHGRVQALSRQFYSQITWPEGYPGDAYSYLFCKQQGFAFVYVATTGVIYRSPSTIADHRRQSLRYKGGKKKLETVFSPQFVRAEYKIPPFLFLESLLFYLVSKPITSVCYLLIMLKIKLTSGSNVTYQQKWEIAGTSKKVV